MTYHAWYPCRHIPYAVCIGLYRQVMKMEYYNTDFTLSSPPVVTELPPPPAAPAQEPESRFWRLLRNQCATALVLCALLLSMEFWWPSGVQTARKWLICQEVGPVEAAAQVFVQEVVQGAPVSDAVTAFCEEVLEHVSPPAAAHAQDEG